MTNNFPKIPIFISVTFFMFSCLLFVFLYKKTNDNNQKTQQNTIFWQTEISRREKIKFLEYSIQTMASDRAMLETRFAKSSDVVPFFDTIEKLAPLVKVTAEINSVDILKDNTGLMVGVKASGSFESIYKFLTLLENSPYELRFLFADIHKSTSSDISEWEAVFKIQLLSFIP